MALMQGNLLKYKELLKQPPVELCFFLQFHWVRARRAGHSPPADRGLCLNEFSHLWNLNLQTMGLEIRLKFLARLAAGGYNRPALWHLAKKREHIGPLNNLQKVVIGIVLQPPDLPCSIKQRNSLLLAELHNPLFIKPFNGFLGLRGIAKFTFEQRCGSLFKMRLDLKMSFVPEVNQPLNPPEIIDPVRVKEFHAPPGLRRRKTAQKQHLSVHRQKRFKRMLLNCHISTKIQWT